MAERKKSVQFVTPKGRFSFPKLHEPDTKFKKEGEYSVKLILGAEDAQALIAKLQPLHDEAVEQGKEKYAALPVKTRKQTEFKVTPFYSPVYDKETEEETGEYEFNFKMTASGEIKSGPKAGQKWTRKPQLFDAKGKPLPKSVQIWSGTIGKVAFEVGEGYYTTAAGAGISLRLNAVQVIELVSGGKKDAKGYGFTQEDGYEADEEFEDETEGQSEGGEDSGSDDDDDF